MPEKKKVVQGHHIFYGKEELAKVTRGEHWALTQINRHKNPSKGFLRSMLVFVILNMDKAKEL